MDRRLLTATAMALAVTFSASLPAFANPAGQTGSQSGTSRPAITAGAQARVDALLLSVDKLNAVLSLIPETAQVQFQAAIQLLVDQADAEVGGQVASNAKAAEALVQLQAVAETEGLPTEAQTQIQTVTEELTIKLNLTTDELSQAAARVTGKPAETGQTEESGQPAETGKPAETGTVKANLARAAAAARLQTMLDDDAFAGGQAAGKIEALVTKLSTELTTSGEAGSEQEALAAIEAAVEAKANKTDADLDVQAEVEVRQGKKDEARATMKARLEVNPHTQVAYEKLIGLEVEAGEHQELDTFVAGKKVAFDVRPLIQENRTLVPIRALVEALGADVAYNAETRVVTITKDGKSIQLTIGSNIALVDGQEVTLDAAAQIVEGNRTVVPVRFISEGLGLYVKWLAEHRTILVTEEPVADQ